MTVRSSNIIRKTNETDIKLALSLDGSGVSRIDTGCGFLDHMLELFSRHGRFDLEVDCLGDTRVDFHHTVEDVGICLGRAIKEALGDMRGIVRYGDIALPMDETLILCALDVSGRSCLVYNVDIPAEKVGEFDTELAKEFFLALTRSADITLHFHKLSGENSHHIIEGCFKAFGRALSRAVAVDERLAGEIPSTKGVL